MNITLDKNWTISTDTYSWKLEFSEPRMRTNKKTQKEEEYVFTDAWYYPRISTCLETYLEKSAQQNKTVEEILETIKRVENNIANIKQDIFRKK